MKILKPGKVDMRRFVCPMCACEFVATEQEKYLAHDDYYQAWMEVQCPCGVQIKWDNGEPYEEPTPTQGGIDRLTSIIADLGYMNETTAWDIAVQLVEHGVTFRG